MASNRFSVFVGPRNASHRKFGQIQVKIQLKAMKLTHAKKLTMKRRNFEMSTQHLEHDVEHMVEAMELSCGLKRGPRWCPSGTTYQGKRNSNCLIAYTSSVEVKSQPWFTTLSNYFSEAIKRRNPLYRLPHYVDSWARLGWRSKSLTASPSRLLSFWHRFLSLRYPPQNSAKSELLSLSQIES